MVPCDPSFLQVSLMDPLCHLGWPLVELFNPTIEYRTQCKAPGVGMKSVVRCYTELYCERAALPWGKSGIGHDKEKR